MATIGVLDIAFRARTAQFNKGVGGARRTMTRFVGGMRYATAGLAAFGAAGAAAAYGMYRFLKPSLEAIDSVAKMSDRLGIATEALTGLQYAGKITGTTIAGIDKGLTMMSRRLGEAAQGTGEGKDALELLGISMDGILAMSPDKQFGLIADRMEGLATQSAKTAVAADLFGRSGVELVNILGLGSKGIEELIRQNEKLGGSFDRISAGRIEKANDAITRMGRVVEGVRNRLAISLAPTLENVTRFGAAAFATMGLGWEICLKQMELSWMQMESRVMFFAETTIPEAMRRIGADPGGFLDAMFGFGKTAADWGAVWVGLDNVAKNFAGAMDAAFGGADFEWTPIFAGYEKGMGREFGEMPKHAVGELEKTLNAELLTLKGAIKTKWADVFGMKFVDTGVGKMILDLDPDAADILRKLAQATPGALRVGSREAYSYTVQSRYRTMAATAQKQLVEEKKIRTATERTAKAAENWVTEMAVATF